MSKYNIVLVILTICVIIAYTQQIILENRLKAEFQEYRTHCERYKDTCRDSIVSYSNLINEFRENNSILQDNLSKTQDYYADFRKKYNVLSKKYSELKNRNQNLKSQKGLVNPTYEELWDFILEDRTNNLEWSEEFDCTEFSNNFIKNFARKGFFACTTEITFEDDTGHLYERYWARKKIFKNNWR